MMWLGSIWQETLQLEIYAIGLSVYVSNACDLLAGSSRTVGLTASIMGVSCLISLD